MNNEHTEKVDAQEAWRLADEDYVHLNLWRKLPLNEKGDMVEAQMIEDGKEEGTNGMEV